MSNKHIFSHQLVSAEKERDRKPLLLLCGGQRAKWESCFFDFHCAFNNVKPELLKNHLQPKAWTTTCSHGFLTTWQTSPLHVNAQSCKSNGLEVPYSFANMKSIKLWVLLQNLGWFLFRIPRFFVICQSDFVVQTGLLCTPLFWISCSHT